MTTIFGPDISSYQSGLAMSRLAAASFVIAKTTEGTFYTDADYEGWCRQTVGLGKPFVWYHFLSGEDAHLQAAHTLAHVGDPGLPGMLDAEPAGSFSPSLAQMIAYVDAAHAKGLNLRLVYLPRWYWQQIGSPNLKPFADRGVRLVSSSYPGGHGSPAALYPGDSAVGWQAYGGLTPLLYQFTNQASDGGQLLDYNAFRGSVDQLRSYLQSPAPAPAPAPSPAPTQTPSTDPEDDDMPACVTGEIKPGEGAVTVLCPPPPNAGRAEWGNVWLSFGSDFGTAEIRVAAYIHGSGWDIKEHVHVPAEGDRVNPWNGPLPPGTQKVSVMRGEGHDVPLAYLIEAAHR